MRSLGGDDTSNTKFLIGITGTLVTAAIIGLLGWSASTILANHDQLIALQVEIIEITASRQRITDLEKRVQEVEWIASTTFATLANHDQLITDLEKRVQEVEYWQRYHGLK
jgi:hypothetical protein